MSGCACSCDYDGEAPSVYRESFPIARKAYKCCECGTLIRPGQKHQVFTGLWDGVWQTFRTCLPCYNIREDYCECAPFGKLYEAFYECMGFDYTGTFTEDGDADA